MVRLHKVISIVCLWFLLDAFSIGFTYFIGHGPLTTYVNLGVPQAPRMPGTFSPVPRVSDSDIYHFTYVTHVPWRMLELEVSFEVGRGENVSGIPGACATRNYTYLVRGPRWTHNSWNYHTYIKTISTRISITTALRTVSIHVNSLLFPLDNPRLADLWPFKCQGHPVSLWCLPLTCNLEKNYSLRSSFDMYNLERQLWYLHLLTRHLQLAATANLS